MMAESTVEEEEEEEGEEGGEESLVQSLWTSSPCQWQCLRYLSMGKRLPSEPSLQIDHVITVTVRGMVIDDHVQE
jgi:hypothetical protein